MKIKKNVYNAIYTNHYLKCLFKVSLKNNFKKSNKEIRKNCTENKNFGK